MAAPAIASAVPHHGYGSAETHSSTRRADAGGSTAITSTAMSSRSASPLPGAKRQS